MTFKRIAALAIVMASFSRTSSPLQLKAGHFEQQTTAQLECPDIPASSLHLKVQNYWVAEECLWAEIEVTNTGTSIAYVPSRNSEFLHYEAEIFNSQGESVLYCHGVSVRDYDTFQFDLLAPKDVLELAPQEHAILGPICVAPFWWYLQDPEYDATSFRLSYRGYTPPPLDFPTARNAEFVAVQCCRIESVIN